MFCPNCGNNCGDARFCTACGTQVQKVEVQKQPKEAQEKVWTEGMPCPYCGGMQIENGKCVFCGVQLLQDIKHMDDQDDSYEFPYGGYVCLGDGIKLETDACVVTKSILFKKYVTRIPYNQLVRVMYIRAGAAGDLAESEYIVFRWEGNKTEPLPAKGKYAADKTTIMITQKHEYMFYHIFFALKTKVPPSVKFTVVTPPLVKELQGRIPDDLLNEYFERYSPFREKAAKEACKAANVTLEEAKKLVDNKFAARQLEQYNAKPSLAVRDLNRIIQAREMAAEEHRVKMEERRRSRR